ncbi:hypothetical protein F5876DRAFT_77221 [Lentinula aff. lateritia]|uniref:Uncharacterized protein n=1 Tax=Lentinula aff. lateritia TaxID=2804960 RepID=A0ACC1TYV7_9AGAR|nr:hypothetical protein F5876DRAFT_77221 [Lentinula aff. lateritia]
MTSAHAAFTTTSTKNIHKLIAPTWARTMQNPEQEITSVALTLTTAETPDIQKAAFLKYVARDVGFKHPLCYVPPGRNSRDSLLGIYQWYRILSPKVIGRMHNVVYDKENHTLLLDMSQKFHIRLSPFKPAWSRLLVRITLKETNGLHYISFQEDFYHPEARLCLTVGSNVGSCYSVCTGRD